MRVQIMVDVVSISIAPIQSYHIKTILELPMQELQISKWNQ